MGIEIIKFSFKYPSNSVTTLKDINFKAANRDLIILLGPNGAGKTTLINGIMGNLEHYDGVIKIFNEKPNNINAQKRMLYLSSDENLPNFLKGSEYISFMAKMYDKKIKDSDIDFYCKELKLENSIGKMIDSYSHGTKKKLQFLIAFLMKPDILIIDETLNGIDIITKNKIINHIKSYHTNDRIVILCTHDFSFLSNFEARVIFIDNGEITFDGHQNNMLLSNYSEAERFFLEKSYQK